MTNIVSRELLQEMAGEASFSRGVKYFDAGRVTGLRVDGESIHATVRGSRPYRVELRQNDDELGYSCTCPLYCDTEAFCKHCVAVALAFLEDAGQKGARKAPKSSRAMSMKDIRSHLLAQNKECLVDLLLRHAGENDRLRGRLIMMASGSGKKPDLPSFRKVIDEAVAWEGVIDYKSTYEYSQGIQDVIDSLRDLLEDDRPTEVIDLTEYSLHKLEGQMEMMDDSDGFMTGILSEIQELHHAACAKVKPDPGKLAARLLHWELRSDWEVFAGAVDQYADVLGERGVEAYRALAEEQWAVIPVLGPGDEDRAFSGKRHRITSIMERLAARTGDVEKLVAVNARDLSSAYNYLMIAETYRKAGEKTQALEWAEKGVKAFPKETDSRLREFLANEYHKLNRHEEAMELIWADFTEHPRLEEYKLLKSHAVRAGGIEVWKTWREKALQVTRTSIDKARQSARKSRWVWNRTDHSDLVAILLWEKNAEAAWLEAQEGGCSDSLWLTLAERREKGHPEDAVTIYQRFVEPTLARKNNDSYREAIELLSKMGKIHKRLDKTEQWKRYLQELHASHRRKRNFIKLLDKLK